MKSIFHSLFLSLFCLLIYSGLKAQDPVSRLQQAAKVDETTAVFAKKVQASGNALTLVIEGNVEEIQAVLEDRFIEATGEKVKNFKGLQSVESVIFADISPRKLDYYYRVEGVENTDDKYVRITLFISAGYYNFLDSEKYPEEMAAAVSFLQSLDKKTKIYQLEQQQLAQQEEIARQQKIATDLGGRAEKLVKEVTGQEETLEKLAAEMQKLKEKIQLAEVQLEKLKNDQIVNQKAQELQAGVISEAVAKLQKIETDLAGLRQ